MTPLEEELLDLRDRVYDLVELNRKLMEVVAPTGAIFPPKWGLNGQESTILALLWLHHRVVDFGELHTAITTSKNNKPSSPIVRVVVYRIRTKLKNLGVKIDGGSAGGYFLSDETREIIGLSVSSRMGFFNKISKSVKANRPSMKQENNFTNVLTP